MSVFLTFLNKKPPRKEFPIWVTVRNISRRPSPFPRFRTDGRSVLRWRHNQIFSAWWVTNFSYPWCFAGALRALKLRYKCYWSVLIWVVLRWVVLLSAISIYRWKKIQTTHFNLPIFTIFHPDQAILAVWELIRCDLTFGTKWIIPAHSREPRHFPQWAKVDLYIIRSILVGPRVPPVRKTLHNHVGPNVLWFGRMRSWKTVWQCFVRYFSGFKTQWRHTTGWKNRAKYSMVKRTLGDWFLERSEVCETDC